MRQVESLAGGTPRFVVLRDSRQAPYDMLRGARAMRSPAERLRCVTWRVWREVHPDSSSSGILGRRRTLCSEPTQPNTRSPRLRAMKPLTRLALALTPQVPCVILLRALAGFRDALQPKMAV